MECAECGFSYVETLASDRRMHRTYHNAVLFGLKRNVARRLPAVWEQSGESVRVVSSRSPLAHRKLAEELSLVAAQDTDEFSFVAYHATEPQDERDCHLFLGAKGDYLVSYLVLERRFRVCRCSWEQYDARRSSALAPSLGVWSVGFIWVSRANRRRGWARRTLDAARVSAGLAWSDVAWHTPFSESGEALARAVCPEGVLLGV